MTNDQQRSSVSAVNGFLGITMSFLDQIKHIKALKEPEQRLAWTIAIAADILQIAAFPLFVEGGISPADTLLDLGVGFMMVRLLGWHWAFLPTAAAKLIPGADLFPTWTTAVWFVTRNQLTDSSSDPLTPDPISNSQPGDVEILPPGPAPAPRR
jgi:hypothetical protein